MGAMGAMLLVTGVFIALAANDAGVVAHDGWMRPVPKSLTEGAIYVVVENHTDQKRSIVSGTSDIAGEVELHQMTMDGKLMKMNRIPKVDVPAHGKAKFEEGALHIMLFDLKEHPAVGDTVTVNLKLDDGTVVPVAATVRKK